MGSVFALLSAVPGKERELLDRLAEFPGVLQRQLLFGEEIAVRIEGSGLADAQALANVAGVREARVYHERAAWIVRPRAPAIASGTNT